MSAYPILCTPQDLLDYYTDQRAAGKRPYASIDVIGTGVRVYMTHAGTIADIIPDETHAGVWKVEYFRIGHHPTNDHDGFLLAAMTAMTDDPEPDWRTTLYGATRLYQSHAARLLDTVETLWFRNMHQYEKPTRRRANNGR